MTQMVISNETWLQWTRVLYPLEVCALTVRAHLLTLREALKLAWRDFSKISGTIRVLPFPIST